MVELFTGQKLKVLRSNNGGEYTSENLPSISEVKTFATS